MNSGVHRRRLEALEELARAHRPGPSTAAREYMSGLLRRYAEARRAGAVGEELEAEFREVFEALRLRAAEARGEGHSN